MTLNAAYGNTSAEGPIVFDLGTGNCTGGHVPLCKPRLSWDHGVGAYVIHERELLVHFCLGVRG